MPLSNSLETNLRDRRRLAADEAFAAHDFGEAVVTDAGAWTEDGVYWSRWVYGDTEEGDRFRASYGVEFRPDTDFVIESWVEAD